MASGRSTTIAALIIGCTAAAAFDTSSAAMADHNVALIANGDSILRWGARLRFVADADSALQTAVVGTIAECLVVLQQQGTGFARIRLDRVVSLEVSSLFPGVIGQDSSRTYTRAQDTTGEQWHALDLAAIRRRYGGCVMLDGS